MGGNYTQAGPCAPPHAPQMPLGMHPMMAQSHTGAANVHNPGQTYGVPQGSVGMLPGAPAPDMASACYPSHGANVPPSLYTQHGEAHMPHMPAYPPAHYMPSMPMMGGRAQPYAPSTGTSTTPAGYAPDAHRAPAYFYVPQAPGAPPSYVQQAPGGAPGYVPQAPGAPPGYLQQAPGVTAACSTHPVACGAPAGYAPPPGYAMMQPPPPGLCPPHPRGPPTVLYSPHQHAQTERPAMPRSLMYPPAPPLPHMPAHMPPGAMHLSAGPTMGAAMAQTTAQSHMQSEMAFGHLPMHAAGAQVAPPAAVTTGAQNLAPPPAPAQPQGSVEGASPQMLPSPTASTAPLLQPSASVAPAPAPPVELVLPPVAPPAAAPVAPPAAPAGGFALSADLPAPNPTSSTSSGGMKTKLWQNKRPKPNGETKWNTWIEISPNEKKTPREPGSYVWNDLVVLHPEEEEPKKSSRGR